LLAGLVQLRLQLRSGCSARIVGRLGAGFFDASLQRCDLRLVRLEFCLEIGLFGLELGKVSLHPRGDGFCFSRLGRRQSGGCFPGFDILLLGETALFNIVPGRIRVCDHGSERFHFLVIENAEHRCDEKKQDGQANNVFRRRDSGSGRRELHAGRVVHAKYLEMQSDLMSFYDY
jgi:hypothetical protein